MSFYSGLADTSARLIDQYGQDVVITIDNAGSYDPITGADTGTETVLNVRGVKLEYSRGDIDGTLIRSGDFKLLVDGEHDIPKDSYVTIGGKKFVVVMTGEINPAGTRLLTKVQCR